MKNRRALSFLTGLLLTTLFCQGLTGVWILALKSEFSFVGLLSYYSPKLDEAKSFIGILEIYWFHIFSVSLVAFVFAHFLPLIGNISDKKQEILRRIFMISSALFLASPFLAYYFGSFFAITGATSLLALQVAMLIEIYFLLKLLISSSEKST